MFLVIFAIDTLYIVGLLTKNNNNEHTWYHLRSYWYNRLRQYHRAEVTRQSVLRTMTVQKRWYVYVRTAIGTKQKREKLTPDCGCRIF